jgi:hypothetical protein
MKSKKCVYWFYDESEEEKLLCKYKNQYLSGFECKNCKDKTNIFKYYTIKILNVLKYNWRKVK